MLFGDPFKKELIQINSMAWKTHIGRMKDHQGSIQLFNWSLSIQSLLEQRESHPS